MIYGDHSVSYSNSAPGFKLRELLMAGRKVLEGRTPMLSIEITRECPLHCPGCYAYGDDHLGGAVTLRQLSDHRGDALVEGVLDLVRLHQPIHVSLVGGEPMVRHKELNRILPALSKLGVFTLVVTSGVIPIPADWMQIPRLRVAVSVDGLPEHHDIRRKPATYERILDNIDQRSVNIHWTITRPMLCRPNYLEEYVAFWSARPEVNRIWVSLYSPQMGEDSAEMLTRGQRQIVADTLVPLRHPYPKLLINQGIAEAFVNPPRNPAECLFSKMSTNYSADLKTRVEPCIFGGTPDCRQCGCAISSGLHWIQGVNVIGPLRANHFIRGFIAVGSLLGRVRTAAARPTRWKTDRKPKFA
jgi:MoaA/NifB/PqqE/SkfB family radical SAM enzyme